MKGDIIAFLDDDAVADKNLLEELVQMHEEHDAIVYHKVSPERLVMFLLVLLLRLV